MVEQVIALAQSMGAAEGQDGLLALLCQAAVEDLSGQLKAGMTAEDCGSAFPVACAMMALSAVEQGIGGGGVESFTAGDVSIHRSQSGNASAMTEQARRLMAPFVQEQNFAFRGV